MKHESSIALKDEWITPKWITDPLGSFDLDPCAPEHPPWNIAKNFYSFKDNGLMAEWYGRVWLNPPYGKNIDLWMNRIATHGHGIALVFARTETSWFRNYVWPAASGMLFLGKRITFFNVDGTPAKGNSGAPSVLISYGDNNESLELSGLPGKFVNLMPNYYVIVIDRSGSKTWRLIVQEAMSELGKNATLDDIYMKVVNMAPKKVKGNKHFKAKIRQTLQLYFTNVKKGVWS